MLLTVSTTHRPATDLGYLLHKNPARAQVFNLPFGKAHVFYPEASEECCTVALLLDIDPISLVRGRGAILTDYVNDRPYIASSFLSVAIARVFGSALGGRSSERPELVDESLPLTAEITALRCDSETSVRSLFEPLGYDVNVDPSDTDESSARYRNVRLVCRKPLTELLTHVYVLVPTLDNRKHYWIGDDEVDKLIARGEGWLEEHPNRDFIVRRYLKHQRNLTEEALARLRDDGDAELETHATASVGAASLGDHRIRAVVRVLADSGAVRVLDLGCGEGRLIEALLRLPQISEIAGIDVSVDALNRAERRIGLERMPDRQRQRVKLLQGALTYRDARLGGYDAAAVIEALEHLEPARLGAFEQMLFHFAKPETIVVTTPNRDYNVNYAELADGGLRHPDHRFEWSREEFASWAASVAAAHGYSVTHEPVGDVDPTLGAPTQMAVFKRCN